MPRGSRGGGRPAARPAPAPARPAAAPQQSRPMTTTARPSTNTAQQGTQQAGAKQGQSPGLFGQMASTAAGVAVGSSIGHAIGGFFGGGSSAQEQLPEQTQYQQPVDAYGQPGGAVGSNLYGGSGQVKTSASRGEASGPCANDLKQFTDCMNQNRGDMNVCGWYMEQLRACQMAAKQY